MFEYEIGGKKYIQEPLVLGQIEQLLDLMQGVVIPSNVDTMGIIAALGNKLSMAIAIVLIPEGISLREKKIEQALADIKFELSPEQTIQVIEDFFTCNPIVSLLERLSGTAEKIMGQISKETLLKKSASSSAEAISQKETASSGDIHLLNASPTLNSDSGK